MKRPSADCEGMLDRIFGGANISQAYQVYAGTEAAFGFMVADLGPIGAQVPDFDVPILAHASEVLAIIGQGNSPHIFARQMGCIDIISTSF